MYIFRDDVPSLRTLKLFRLDPKDSSKTEFLVGVTGTHKYGSSAELVQSLLMLAKEQGHENIPDSLVEFDNGTGSPSGAEYLIEASDSTKFTYCRAA